MSEKREHEDDEKSDPSDDECVGPSLSEATDTVEKKKRKGKVVFCVCVLLVKFLIKRYYAILFV